MRPPAMAGKFYPEQPGQLGRMVETFLDEARVAGGISAVKAVIAPHAGYLYSGPIAGTAFRVWLEERHKIQRIVLIGPSHYLDFPGIAVPGATAFATPLGDVDIDRDALRTLAGCRQIKPFDAAHENEHSLEVELPFLQCALANFTIVPLVTGNATDDELMEMIKLIWGGDETRFVISSDLSHYRSYEVAQRIDRETSLAIERGETDRISAACACGHLAVRSFMRAAERRGLAARTLDLRNSGDTAGPRERVVGYGAFVFAP